MADPNAPLTRTLRLAPAVGLALTVVVGSGVLVLPGLAYDQLGEDALASWLVAALVSVPLLIVIAFLGARYPDAGGIAGFVRPALGARTSGAAELLLLGAIPGGAGLALVGGNLLADLVGGDAAVAAGAIVVLAIAALTASRGAGRAGRVQLVLSSVFVLMLAALAAGALLLADRHGVGLGTPASVVPASRHVGLVFFAFVGWELMAFTSAEFVDARRDFPRMIAASFLIVVGLYAALAAATQLVLSPDDPDLTTAPAAALARAALGGTGRAAVILVGLLIVIANVNGVVLAFSRLVYASARNGLLPGGLGRTHGEGNPLVAVGATCLAFAAFVLPERLGVIDQATLFRLAAACFFAGYLLATVAYLREARTGGHRFLGVVALLTASVVFATFGVVALYPLVLFTVGWLRSGERDPSSR